MTYPDYPESTTQLEEEVLDRWRSEDLFQQTLDATADGDEFVFYEGPPTANGRPGLHHVVSRTLKDLVCRYWTMRGRHVTRIAGWDTHGLPVEIEAEKKLGISGKREIEDVGVETFNRTCRESVFTYKEEWEELSERIGYWLDYSNPYVTFHAEYIESVWWILKQLDDKGLIYRGHRSVPYCPRCGTALSSHEVAQGYEQVEDPSLYFLCPILDGAGEPTDRALVAWTTTPWTLPANVALAVHPGLNYVEVESGGRTLIVAESCVESVFGGDAEVTGTLPGRELVGLRYARPFELVAVTDEERQAGWMVIAADFVSAEEGTGIVHIAPAFGADDYTAGQEHGLPLLRPVDDAGRFDASLELVGGQFVKAADEVLLDALDEAGLLLRRETIEHAYPHCWRCSSPLLYMARDSWYIRTTEMKDVMIENNRQVAWHPPEIGTGRFGEWLEGNVDWALSRDRYWGTPLPAWVCDADADHIEVLGSFAELEERAGPLPDDFDPHKPWIDAYTWPCASCAGTMRRTPEVIDVWFDSGSMPYAQWHYPFENEEDWARHFPADYICEGVDQTRGWFYSLMAISSMLGLGPAYGNVIVNDMLLDKDGQKMSKSKGNAVDPWDAIDAFGADVLRWYFLTVSNPWLPKRYDPEAVHEMVRRVFDTLANTYRFFALYANLEGWTPADADDEGRGTLLDRWLASRLSGLVREVRAELDAYEPTKAARAIGDFIVDDLSNWYVRRSRDRFWGAAGDADPAAFRALHHALCTTARLLAPFTPFTADWLHRALTGGESVHLTGYPEAVPDAADAELEAGMGAVRTMASLGRAARDSVRIRVRQPLRTLYAVVPDRVTLPPGLLEILKDELNVKEVRFLADAAELVLLRAKPNFRALGQRFGSRTPDAAEAVRALSSDALEAFRAGGTLSIEVEGETFPVTAEDLDIQEEARGELAVESGEGVTVALDPSIDDALRREGLARELVNRIQRLRRDEELEVSDRIRLGIYGDGAVADAVDAFGDWITQETLAVELEVGEVAPDAGWQAVRDIEVDDVAASIALSVASGGDAAERR